mgnify:CR=1 FL=1
MTDEDDEFARIEREQASGWRKQQIEQKKELDPYRNLVLEEVATQFDMMPALGDTAADRKSTRLNSSHIPLSRMPSSA